MLTGVIGFVAGFAVAFILATLRNRSDIEGREEEYCRVLNVSINSVSELEEERQELRDRLAAEIWRNRRLNRTQDDPIDTLLEERQSLHDHLAVDLSRTRHGRSTPDDETQWRTDEIERQIRAWEKL